MQMENVLNTTVPKVEAVKDPQHRKSSYYQQAQFPQGRWTTLCHGISIFPEVCRIASVQLQLNFTQHVFSQAPFQLLRNSCIKQTTHISSCYLMIRKTGSLHFSSSKYVRFLFLYSSVPWHSLYNNPSPASTRQLNTFGPSKLFPVSPCPISEYLIEDTTQEAQQGDGQRGNLPYSSERLEASGQWSQTTTFTPVLNTHHGHVHDTFRQPLLTPAQCAESTADQGTNAASILCCGL